MKFSNTATMLAIVLMLVYSSNALASDIRSHWHLYIIGISVISTSIALLITARKKNLENTGIKIMVWGIYFWVVTFIQLIVLSLLYVLA